MSTWKEVYLCYLPIRAVLDALESYENIMEATKKESAGSVARVTTYHGIRVVLWKIERCVAAGAFVLTINHDANGGCKLLPRW